MLRLRRGSRSLTHHFLLEPIEDGGDRTASTNPPAVAIALVMPREQIQQAAEIKAIRFDSSRPPIHLNARRIDHPIGHRARH